MNTIEVIHMLADYFKETDKMTDSRLHVYLNTLSDIRSSDLEVAAYQWIKEGKQFMPKVVELREIVKQLKDRRTYAVNKGAPRNYNEADTATRAWWDSLPPPARTDAELDERYPLSVEIGVDEYAF